MCLQNIYRNIYQYVYYINETSFRNWECRSFETLNENICRSVLKQIGQNDLYAAQTRINTGYIRGLDLSDSIYAVISVPLIRLKHTNTETLAGCLRAVQIAWARDRQMVQQNREPKLSRFVKTHRANSFRRGVHTCTLQARFPGTLRCTVFPVSVVFPVGSCLTSSNLFTFSSCLLRYCRVVLNDNNGLLTRARPTKAFTLKREKEKQYCELRSSQRREELQRPSQAGLNA